jgi:hypothetical protein
MITYCIVYFGHTHVEKTSYCRPQSVAHILERVGSCDIFRSKPRDLQWSKSGCGPGQRVADTECYVGIQFHHRGFSDSSKDGDTRSESCKESLEVLCVANPN